MFNLLRRIKDEVRHVLVVIKPKPVRGFVDEICDDLRTYPEEWRRFYDYSYLHSVKIYSKGDIKITLSENQVKLKLYKHREFEYIYLSLKESTILRQATLNVEKLYHEKREAEQKIKDSESIDTISDILKSFRNH